MKEWPYDKGFDGLTKDKILSFGKKLVDMQPPLGITPERIWLEKRCLNLAFAVQRTLDDLKHRPDYHRLRDLSKELLRRAEELAAIEEAEEATE